MCTCTALLLFITHHLLNWERQGLAEADNELGVETVRVRPCRRGHCRPEWLIGQSVCVFECECVSVAIKIVCCGTLMRSFLSYCCVMLIFNCFSKSFLHMQNLIGDANRSHILVLMHKGCDPEL